LRASHDDVSRVGNFLNTSPEIGSYEKYSLTFSELITTPRGPWPFLEYPFLRGRGVDGTPIRQRISATESRLMPNLSPISIQESMSSVYRRQISAVRSGSRGPRLYGVVVFMRSP